MAISLQKVEGKVNQIKVEAECQKEKEVMVHREIGSLKWKMWNHDDFLSDWQKKYSV
jgi:hypothetical protein